MKKLADILIECIEEIRSGRSSIADCIDRYPAWRRKLEPLLEIAVGIQEPPDVSPSHEFKLRARANLMEHIHSTELSRKPWPFELTARAKQIAWAGRSKLAAVALAIIATVCGLGGGFAYAAQDSLPGDNLYPVKISTEEFRRVFTVGDVAEAELELAFANRRLEEIDATAKTEPDAISMAVNGYQKNVTAGIERAEEIKNPAESANLFESVAMVTLQHLKILDSLHDVSSENSQASIEQAHEIAFSTHVRALRDLAIENPLRAAEINLLTIDSRLARARATAEEKETEKAEIALIQFEELIRLGEDLSQTSKRLGHDTTGIDELNARATAAHMEVLGLIYGKAPEQTKEAVENAMEASAEVHGHAVEGLQEKGAIDDIPQEPPIPDDIPEEVKERILEPESEDSGAKSGKSGNGSGGSGQGSSNSGNGSSGPG